MGNEAKRRICAKIRKADALFQQIRADAERPPIDGYALIMAVVKILILVGFVTLAKACIAEKEMKRERERGAGNETKAVEAIERKPRMDAE